MTYRLETASVPHCIRSNKFLLSQRYAVDRAAVVAAVTIIVLLLEREFRATRGGGGGLPWVTTT